MFRATVAFNTGNGQHRIFCLVFAECDLGLGHRRLRVIVRCRSNAPVQRRAAQRTVRCNPLLAARAPVVNRNRAVAERRRRDELEASRAGQPVLIQGRAVAGDSRVHEELVFIDQIQPVQFGRELATTEKHAGRGSLLQLLYCRAQVAGEVVAVGPREVLSRRRHHVLRLGLELDRPLADRRRCLQVAAGDQRPEALHHLVGNAAPQHCPALVHQASKEGVRFVVGDSFPVIDATVEGDVNAEGQKSHGGEYLVAANVEAVRRKRSAA